MQFGSKQIKEQHGSQIKVFGSRIRKPHQVAILTFFKQSGNPIFALLPTTTQGGKIV